MKNIIQPILTNIIASPDGFTITTTGKNMAQTKFFAVSMHKECEMIINASQPENDIESMIEDWLELTTHLLPPPIGIDHHTNAGNCIGAWMHGGCLYLDVVTLFSKEHRPDLVHDIARENKQIAFFDLELMTEIKTK